MSELEMKKMERFRELLGQLPEDKQEVVMAFVAGVVAMAEKKAS